VLSLGSSCFAQGSNDPTQVSGPVDIQANEQEFAGDQIIARGNVKVVYKDSVIHAPVATMQRDAGGNPQRAVFSGHPHLVQGKNLIDAETLTFDMANSRVLAEGRAHSEVESTDNNANQDDKADGSAGSLLTKPKSRSGGQPEKIITDSDRQEYDRAQDKFEAVGHVKVVHGDITVRSDKLQLVYGADKKPETAIFTGAVVAQQGQNNTMADTITYSLTTKRLQATGHVKSKVVQPKKDLSGKESKRGPQAALPVDPGAAYAATSADNADGDPAGSTEEAPIFITSNSQDYSQGTNRVSADGNVHVYYQDMVGIGPKVILIRNTEGKAERVYFIGRSQVSQTGRRWIADRITITVADKKVLAEGNTRAMIIQQGPKPVSPSIPGFAGSQLAGKPSSSSPSISSRKVENPQ
jgi:lipopolysaccharide export system protein LptA